MTILLIMMMNIVKHIIFYDTSGNAIVKGAQTAALIRFPIISILNRIIYGRRASAMTIILASTMWEH